MYVTIVRSYWNRFILVYTSIALCYHGNSFRTAIADHYFCSKYTINIRFYQFNTYFLFNDSNVCFLYFQQLVTFSSIFYQDCCFIYFSQIFICYKKMKLINGILKYKYVYKLIVKFSVLSFSIHYSIIFFNKDPTKKEKKKA